MCAFLEKWLPEVLGTGMFPIPLVIERTVGRVNAVNTQSRVVIKKRLNYADKVWIMKAARMRGKIRRENKSQVLP